MERPHNNISTDTDREETCGNNNEDNIGEKDKIYYHNRPGNHNDKNNTTEKAKSQ